MNDSDNAQFFYRRRTWLTPGVGKRVGFIFGWMPDRFYMVEDGVLHTASDLTSFGGLPALQPWESWTL